MARVNSVESYEFLKNLPSKNPKTFTTIDRDGGPASQRSNFVRIIDVEENDEERKFTNDKTSLLLRSLKKNWNNTTGSQTQSSSSRPTSSTQNSAMDVDNRPSGSNRRTANSNDIDDFMPATKHRKQI